MGVIIMLAIQQLGRNIHLLCHAEIACVIIYVTDRVAVPLLYMYYNTGVCVCMCISLSYMYVCTSIGFSFS